MEPTTMQSKYLNERTRMCYHQAPPLARVVAHVGDAGQAKPHLEHNPLSLLGTCHAMPLRKLNDPGVTQSRLTVPQSRPGTRPGRAQTLPTPRAWCVPAAPGT